MKKRTSVSEGRNSQFKLFRLTGGCRYKIKSDEDLARIIEVFSKHNVGYFFYCGGGDSMNTANKVSKLARPLIGGPLPKFARFEEIYASSRCKKYTPKFQAFARKIDLSDLYEVLWLPVV